MDDAQAKIATLMLFAMGSFKGDFVETARKKTEEFEHRKQELVRRQQIERKAQKDYQETRRAE